MRWLAHGLAAGTIAALVVKFAVVIAEGKPITTDLSFHAMLAVTLAVGWLLAWKRPRNPLGWLLIAFAGLFAISTPLTLLGDALLDVAPGASTWLYWFWSDRADTWAWIPPIGLLLTQIPLHFPDGRLPSSRWRWFFWFTIGALVVASLALSTSPAEVDPGVPNPTYVPGLSEEPTVVGVVFIGLLATSFVGSIASLFVRYRVAGAIQRAQLRWVLWAVGLAAGTLILSWMVQLLVDREFLESVVMIAYTLIPVSIAFAVLRYRLYDIDRIVSRTASYSLVTLAILSVYLLVVTSITWLTPNLPSVGVALATLAAAAIFLPLLRWTRRWVDRRFNRAQYNAQQVVEGFGERLRNGADPHTAEADLVRAVEETLQVQSIGIWIPKGKEWNRR